MIQRIIDSIEVKPDEPEEDRRIMFENIEFLNKELFWFLLLLPIAWFGMSLNIIDKQQS